MCCFFILVVDFHCNSPLTHGNKSWMQKFGLCSQQNWKMIKITHRWRSGRVLTANKKKKKPFQDKFSFSDHVTIFSRLLFFRLCLCDPRGGGLWGRIPDARCDQENPSQQEVPVFLSALPPLGFRARHAPGPAPVLGGWPGVHSADARLGRHHHADGRCWVSWLPVSGIYQKPVSLLSSHINMRRTRKCLQLIFWALQGTRQLQTYCGYMRTTVLHCLCTIYPSMWTKQFQSWS